ncbi:MAG: trehalose-phosphatase, partial [Planctomycetota bacterium]
MTETAADAPATTRPLDDATIEALARTPRLLVACDYDGTLSPIVENPADAVPIRESVVALQQLCETPDTSVAVVSGRALSDLAQRVDLPPRVHLVGSHGSEFEP